jgi:hypothetical protein
LASIPDVMVTINEEAEIVLPMGEQYPDEKSRR